MNRWFIFILCCGSMTAAVNGSLELQEAPVLPRIQEKSFQLMADKAEDPIAKRDEVWRFRNPGTVAFAAPPSVDRYYATISINPALEPDANRNPIISIAGAQLSFRLLRSPGVANLEVLVYDGEDGWESTRLLYKLGPDHYFGNWVELMVRVDLAAGTYDLYQGKKLWMADIPLREGIDGWSLTSNSLKVTFLKELSFHQTSNPYFEDRNLDGIPDAFTRLYSNDISALGRYDTVEGSTEDLLTHYMQTFGRDE